MTWSLAGKYPRILEDEVVGEEAKRLFKDANEMLDRLSAEKTLNPRGVVGLFPANRVGDDIEIYRDETRTHVLAVSRHLRQQTEKVGFANYCLADFVAPKLSGKADYIGAFAVTGGLEEDALAEAFEAQHDDYNKIMVKAMADRLAEAFAEYLHERVRKVHWGYAANENLSNEELIRENYQGIRPAPGYPACPEHTEKGHHLAAAGCGSPYRHEAHRVVRHVAGRVGFRLVLQPSGQQVLRRGAAAARSGGRLRAAQRHERVRSGALAGPEFRLRRGLMNCRRRARAMKCWQAVAINGDPTWFT